MELGAIALIQQAHGQALRSICRRCNQHFSGLAQASRFLRQEGKGTTRFHRQLSHLDIAFNISRHVTKPRIDAFLSEVDAVTPEPPFAALALEGAAAFASEMKEARAALATEMKEARMALDTELMAARANLANIATTAQREIAHDVKEKLSHMHQQFMNKNQDQPKVGTTASTETLPLRKKDSPSADSKIDDLASEALVQAFADDETAKIPPWMRDFVVESSS